MKAFCNVIMGNCKDALDCLEKYLTNDVIQNQLVFSNLQAYIINMEMSYEEGKFEGGPFCLQWTCFMFNVNIQVWYLATISIANFYSM